MIEVTKLDGENIHVSPHQIEFMDETPDTVLHMISGKKVLVRDDADAVIEKIIQYRQQIGTQDATITETDSTEGS